MITTQDITKSLKNTATMLEAEGWYSRSNYVLEAIVKLEELETKLLAKEYLELFDKDEHINHLMERCERLQESCNITKKENERLKVKVGDLEDQLGVWRNVASQFIKPLK